MNRATQPRGAALQPGVPNRSTIPCRNSYNRPSGSQLNPGHTLRPRPAFAGRPRPPPYPEPMTDGHRTCFSRSRAPAPPRTWPFLVLGSTCGMSRSAGVGWHAGAIRERQMLARPPPQNRIPKTRGQQPSGTCPSLASQILTPSLGHHHARHRHPRHLGPRGQHELPLGEVRGDHVPRGAEPCEALLNVSLGGAFSLF